MAIYDARKPAERQTLVDDAFGASVPGVSNPLLPSVSIPGGPLSRRLEQARITATHDDLPGVGVTVAYLLKRYPRLSETFILHEMLTLERLGAHLHVYSEMNPAERVTHPDINRLHAPVTYLPPVTAQGFLPLLKAHARLLRQKPRRYLTTLWWAFRRRDPLASLKHFTRAGWLGAELQRAGVQRLHAHFAHGPAATAYYVSQLYDIPFSFTGHAKDIYTTPQEHIAERIHAARFVVTCTEFNVRYLASLGEPETAQKIHRIYHGVDLSRFSPRAEPAPQPDARALSAPPLILAVGRLVEKKGLSYLVEACALLRERGISFRCQIIGGGPLRDSLREQIAQAGLAELITLEPPCPQEELVARYQEAAVVTLPCVELENGDRDGIPNVLVEAMAMGVPVVSTSISGIPELITHQRTGMLVPPRDVESLASALIMLLNKPYLRERLGREGARFVHENFDMTCNTRQLIELFQQGE